MDRPRGPKAVVERIWILQRIGTEELDRVAKKRHTVRLTSGNSRGQWAGKESKPVIGPRVSCLVSRVRDDLHRC